MKLMNIFSVSLVSLSVISCATAVRGTTEDVVIKTVQEGATVNTSLNHECKANPCTVKVARKDSFSVTASKPGYHDQTVQVGTKVSGKGAAGMAGNVLLGGVIGIGVDAATGATKDHYPNPVIIDLKPINSGQSVTPQEKAPSQVPNEKKPAPTS